MVATKVPDDAELLERVIALHENDLSREAAEGLLKIRLTRTAQNQIQKLLRKNNRGTISEDECLLLDRYLRIGQLIDLIKAKAHVALKVSRGRQ